MDSLYDDSHYERLEQGIEQISAGLQQKVFGEAIELDKKDWVKQALTKEFEWLFTLETIRQRVHEAAGVPQLHVNEHEARRLLERLQSEQDKIREQAIQEEKEGKHRVQNILNYLEPQAQSMSKIE